MKFLAVFCLAAGSLKLGAWRPWPGAQGIPWAAAAAATICFLLTACEALKAAQIHQFTTSCKPQPLSTALEHVPDGNISFGGPGCAFPASVLHFKGGFLPRICLKELALILASLEVMAAPPAEAFSSGVPRGRGFRRSGRSFVLLENNLGAIRGLGYHKRQKIFFPTPQVSTKSAWGRLGNDRKDVSSLKLSVRFLFSLPRTLPKKHS